MSDLNQMTPVSVEQGASILPANEVARYHQQVPDWQLVTEGGEQRIRRTFTFKNFAQALNFTNQVGKIAEQFNHHPALLTEWGKVTVTWWTHKVKGLHQNDFIMAAKTDDIYQAH